MSLLEFLAAFLGLAGYLMFASGNRHGLWFGLVASALGLALFTQREMYVMAFLQVAYALINLRSLIKTKVHI